MPTPGSPGLFQGTPGSAPQPHTNTDPCFHLTQWTSTESPPKWLYHCCPRTFAQCWYPHQNFSPTFRSLPQWDLSVKTWSKSQHLTPKA